MYELRATQRMRNLLVAIGNRTSSNLFREGTKPESSQRLFDPGWNRFRGGNQRKEREFTPVPVTDRESSRRCVCGFRLP